MYVEMYFLRTDVIKKFLFQNYFFMALVVLYLLMGLKLDVDCFTSQVLVIPKKSPFV